MLKGELLFRLNELWNRRVRTVRVTTYYGGGGGKRWGNGGLEEGWVCTILMIPFIGTYNLLAMTDPAALFLPENQMIPPPC